MKKKAVVVGAGIGGLAIALRLRSKGHEVIVFEKEKNIGGKLDQMTWQGFRWDMGPSLFTLPHLVDELFSLYGKQPSKYLKYDKLDMVCKYFFSDGLIINGYNSPEKFAYECEEKTNISRKKILSYLKSSEHIYNLTSPVFIFNSFHRFHRQLLKSGFKILFNFRKLKAFNTMHNVNKSRLKEQHLIQIFDRFATYNGSNPYKAPATLNVIPYLEHCLGAYFPQKGMFSIVGELYNLAREEGINFYFNEPVTRIEIDQQKISGVQTTKRNEKCDLLVSDSDIVPLYKLFHPELKLKKRYLTHERSSSALIFYWAINKSFKELDLHNILFAEDYEKEFDNLFEQKSFTPDVTVYIFISKKVVESDAPEGKENWFVMINVPANFGQKWGDLIKKMKEAIINKINKTLDTKIENYILKEEILNPEIIEKKTSSFQGSLYGASSNSKWSAFRRHPNFSKKIRNLFFVGGSVHPGGGIPLCLSSAKIVSKMID
jgi:phytoene desaturase